MSPGPDPPLWRQAFDRAERLVGEPLEQVVVTRRFTDALVLVFRVQGAALSAMERGSRTVLHLYGLPSRGDVARVGRQVSALREEVRALAARLEEQDRG